MERFLGLSDYGIFPIIGFGIIVALLISAFKGGGKGNGSSGSNNSNSNTTPTA